MADIRLGQASTGKWKVSLTHNNSNVPTGLVVPVTLKYQNNTDTMVTLNVKRGQTVSAETEWATPVGVEIDTNQISFSGEATYEGKTYRIRSISWEVIPAGDVDEPVITIRYTGSQVSAEAGSTRSFTVTAENATVTGYTVDNGARVTDSGTTFVEITYPANDSQTNTKTYTVTAKGKDSSNNLVEGSTQFTQSKKTTPTQDYLEFVDETDLDAYVNVPCEGSTNHVVRIATSLSSSSWGATSNKTWIHVSKNTSDVLINVDASDEGARNGVVTITGTGVNSLTVPVSQVDCASPGTPVITIVDIEDVRNDFLNVPCSGFPEPGYTFTVNVTPYSEWEITEDTGDMWVHVSKSTSTSYIAGLPVTIETAKVVVDQNGLSQRETTLDIHLVDQSLSTDAVEIRLVQESCSETHRMVLYDDSDLTRFENVPCSGIESPGYMVRIESDVAWHSVVGGDEWIHATDYNWGVQIYIDQNTDPDSGQGDSAREGFVKIVANNSDYGLSDIELKVEQDACDDVIEIPDRSAIVFTCDGPESYTRQVNALPNTEWHAKLYFGNEDDVNWCSLSPTSGVGDGEITVTILKDNYNKWNRGGCYVQFSTGSTETYLDWFDIEVVQEPTPFFDVTGGTATVTDAGGEVQVRVLTNEPIAVTTDDSWIGEIKIGENIRVVGGTGYTIVSFDVQSTTEVRDGSVFIESTYDGVCGPLGNATVPVHQTYEPPQEHGKIYVRKTDETRLESDIEFTTGECRASTDKIEFVVMTTTRCRLVEITSTTGDEDEVTLWKVNGSTEIQIPVGGEFDLIGSWTFEARMGINYYFREKNFKLKFETFDADMWHSDDKASVEITQERNYVIGVCGVTIDSVYPWKAIEGCQSGNMMLGVDICGITMYANGHHGSTERICDYLSPFCDGVNTDYLTLQITSGSQWCQIRPDECQEDYGYQSTCEFPYELWLDANTGHSVSGQDKVIGFRMTYYGDRSGTPVVYDFNLTIPYCYKPYGEQEVYIVDGGETVDEITINPGPNTIVSINLTGMSIGKTKVSIVTIDDSLSESYIKDITINGYTLEPDPWQESDKWLADAVGPTLSFTRVSRDWFSVGIRCEEQDKDDKILEIHFDEWEG